MLLEDAQGPEALLRLCAATDRGQRCTSAERALIASLVRDMEGDAPPADATMLNGNWRLLYASTPSVYRSSPFFWAFKQALAGSTTPVAIPGGGVQPGDAVAEAIYAITDGIPFYNLGAVYQIISGVCGVDTACEVDYPEGSGPSDGVSSADEPSDGTSDRASLGDYRAAMGSFDQPGAAGLISRVELSVPLFGFVTPATSIMTTTSTLEEVPRADAAAPLELRVGVQTTEAVQSTLPLPLPVFPSGDALELASQGSSSVKLLTTYLSSELRISRPVLSLQGAEADGGLFIYARSRDAI
jgi:hypothetical protein